MNYKIKVHFKYIYANPFKTTVDLYEMLNNYERVRETRLESWIENDREYDPLTVFRVSKIKFDKDGKATFIEMSENHGQ